VICLKESRAIPECKGIADRKGNRMQWKSLGLLAVAVALTATVALAQTSPPSPAGTGSSSVQGMPTEGMPEPGSMPMMDMMRMMMAGHVEGRIAFIKAELKITDAQQPLWDPGRRRDTGERERHGWDGARNAVHDAASGHSPRQARRP
jgi:hypothetical protein